MNANMKSDLPSVKQKAREWLETKDDDYLAALRTRLELEQDGEHSASAERARQEALALVQAILVQRKANTYTVLHDAPTREETEKRIREGSAAELEHLKNYLLAIADSNVTYPTEVARTKVLAIVNDELAKRKARP